MLIQAIVASLVIVIGHAGAMLLEELEQTSSPPVQHEFPTLHISSSPQPSGFVSYASEPSSSFDSVNSEYYRHYDHSATDMFESRSAPTGHARYADTSESIIPTSGGVSSYGSSEPIRRYSDHPTSYGTIHANMAHRFQPPNGLNFWHPQYPSKGQTVSANDPSIHPSIFRTPSSTIISPAANIVSPPFQNHNTLPVTGHLRTAPNVRHLPEYAQNQPISFSPGYFPRGSQQPSEQHLMFPTVLGNTLYPNSQAGMPELPMYDEHLDQIVEIINGIPHITKFIRGPRATPRPSTVPVSSNAPLLPYPPYTQPLAPSIVPRTHRMAVPLMEPPAQVESIPRTHNIPSPERSDSVMKYSPTYSEPKEVHTSPYPLPSASPQRIQYVDSPPTEGTVFIYPEYFNSFPSEGNNRGTGPTPNKRTPYSTPAPRRIYIVRSERFVRESYAPGEAPVSIKQPRPIPLSRQYLPPKEPIPTAFNNLNPEDAPSGFPLHPLERPWQVSPHTKIVYVPIEEPPVERYPWNQYSPTPANHAPEPFPQVYRAPEFSGSPENGQGKFSPQTSYDAPMNYHSPPNQKPTPTPPANYEIWPNRPPQPRQPFLGIGPFIDQSNSALPFKTVPQQQYSIPQRPTSQQYPSQFENIVPSQQTEPRPSETYPQKQYPSPHPTDEDHGEISYLDGPPAAQYHPPSGQISQQIPQQRTPFRDSWQPDVEYITDFLSPEPSTHFQDNPSQIPRTVKVIRKVVIRRIVTNTSHPEIEYVYPEEIPLPEYPSQPGGLNPEQRPHYPEEFKPQPRNPSPRKSPFFDGANPDMPYYDTIPPQQYQTSPILPSQQYPSYPSQPDFAIPHLKPEHVGPYETAPQNQYPGSSHPSSQLHPSVSLQPSYNHPTQSNEPPMPYELSPQDQYPTSPNEPSQSPQSPSVNYAPPEQTKPTILNSFPRWQHPTRPDHIPQVQHPSYPSTQFLIPNNRDGPFSPENTPGQQYPLYSSPDVHYYPSDRTERTSPLGTGPVQKYPVNPPQPQQLVHQEPSIHFIPSNREPTNPFGTTPNQHYPPKPSHYPSKQQQTGPYVQYNPSDRSEPLIPYENAPKHQYPEPTYHPSQPQQPSRQPTSVYSIPSDRTEPTMPFETNPDQQYPARPSHSPFKQQLPSPSVQYNPRERSEPLTPYESAPKPQHPVPTYYPSQLQNQPYPTPSVQDNPSDTTKPFTPNEDFPRQRRYPVEPPHLSQLFSLPYPSPSINHIATPEPGQPLLPEAQYAPFRPGQRPLDGTEPQGRPVVRYIGEKPLSLFPTPTRSPFTHTPEYNSLPNHPEQHVQHVPVFPRKSPTVAQEPFFDSEVRDVHPNPALQQPGIRHPFSQKPSDAMNPELESIYPTQQLPDHLRKPIQRFPIRTIYEEEENEQEEIVTEHKPRPQYQGPLKPLGRRPSFTPSELDRVPVHSQPTQEVKPYQISPYEEHEIPVKEFPQDQTPSIPLQYPTSLPQLHDWPERAEPIYEPTGKIPPQPSKMPQKKPTPYTRHTYFEEEENEEENIVTRPKPHILQPLPQEERNGKPQRYPQSPDKHSSPSGHTPQPPLQYDHIPQKHYPYSPTHQQPQIKQPIHRYPSDSDTSTELHHHPSDFKAPIGPSTLRRVPQKHPMSNQPYYENPDEYLGNSPIGTASQEPHHLYRPKLPSSTHTYYEQEENEEEQILAEPMYPTQHLSSPLTRSHPNQPYLLSPTEIPTSQEESESGRYPPQQPGPSTLRKIPQHPTSGELPLQESPFHRKGFPVSNAPFNEYPSQPLHHPSQFTHPQYPSDMKSNPQQFEPEHVPSGQMPHTMLKHPGQTPAQDKPFYHEPPTIDDGGNPTQIRPQKYVSSPPKPKSTHSYYEEEENVEEITEEHPPWTQHRTSPVHSDQRHPNYHPQHESTYPHWSEPITQLPFEETSHHPSTSEMFQPQPSTQNQPEILPDQQVLRESQEEYTPMLFQHRPSKKQPSFEPVFQQPFEPTFHTTPINPPNELISEGSPHYMSPGGFQLIEPEESIPYYPFSGNPPQPKKITEVLNNYDGDDLSSNERRPHPHPHPHYIPDKSREIEGWNTLPIREKVTKTSNTYKNAIYDDIPSEEYLGDGTVHGTTNPKPLLSNLLTLYPTKQSQQPKTTRDSRDDDDSTIQNVLNSLPPNFDLSKICPFLEKMRNNKHPTDNAFESGENQPIFIPTTKPIVTENQTPPTTGIQTITTSDDKQPATGVDSHPITEVIEEPSSEVYGPTIVNEVKDLQEATTVVDSSAPNGEANANTLSEQVIPDVAPPKSNPHESLVEPSTLPANELQNPMPSSLITEKEVEVEEENNISAISSSNTIPVTTPAPSKVIEQENKSMSSGVHDTISHISEEPIGSMTRKVMTSRVIEHMESNITPGSKEQITVPTYPTAQGTPVNKRLVMDGGSSSEALEEGMIQKTVETSHPSASLKMMSSSISSGATVSGGMTTGGGGKMVRYVTVTGNPSAQSGTVLSRSSGSAIQPTPPRYKLVTIPGSIQTFTPAFPPGTKMITSSITSGSAPGFKTVRVPIKVVNG